MKKIFWIDLSSEGDASFYSNAWRNALGNKADYFVHQSNFYAHKFYNYRSFKKTNKLYKVLYFLYLSSLLILSIIPIRFKYHKVILNIYQPFIFYLIYIKILKALKIDFQLIIHDVETFGTELYPKIILTSNERLIKSTNSVILHNGVIKFNELYDFNKEIIQIPFPIRKPFSENIKYQIKFLLPDEYILFIGKYRIQKGLEQLLNLKNGDLIKFKLVLATDINSDLKNKFLDQLGDSVIIINQRLSDSDFSWLIKKSTYGICPYVGGTNSGIYSTLISNSIPTITSSSSVFDDFFQFEDLKILDFNKIGVMISNLPTRNTQKYQDYLNSINDFLNKQEGEFKEVVKTKIL